jgi:hypothetical protein
MAPAQILSLPLEIKQLIGNVRFEGRILSSEQVLILLFLASSTKSKGTQTRLLTVQPRLGSERPFHLGNLYHENLFGTINMHA